MRFIQPSVQLSTYSLPLEVEVAGQHDVCSRDLHLLSLEDEVELFQLFGGHYGLKPMLKFEKLKSHNLSLKGIIIGNAIMADHTKQN